MIWMNENLHGHVHTDDGYVLKSIKINVKGENIMLP